MLPRFFLLINSLYVNSSHIKFLFISFLFSTFTGTTLVNRVAITMYKRSLNWLMLISAKNNLFNLVKALVKIGADITTADKKSNTAVTFFAKNNNFAAVRYLSTIKPELLSHIGEFGETALTWFANHRNREALIFFNINNQNEFNTKNKDGNTAAAILVLDASEDCSILVELAEFNPNIIYQVTCFSNWSAEIPFWLAYRNDGVGVLELARIYPNILEMIDANGDSITSLLAENNNGEIVHRLAMINNEVLRQVHHNGYTPAIQLFFYGNYKAIVELAKIYPKVVLDLYMGVSVLALIAPKGEFNILLDLAKIIADRVDISHDYRVIEGAIESLSITNEELLILIGAGFKVSDKARALLENRGINLPI